ncbi:mCG1026688, isoform CRA_a [Mus musculus]|nr:mCG1026688, isoform CRA_a [Mus musculus]
MARITSLATCLTKCFYVFETDGLQSRSQHPASAS